MNFKIAETIDKLLADTYTPVGLYLLLRDLYPNALLLESSEYNKKNNNYSYICLNPIAYIKAYTNKVETYYYDRALNESNLKHNEIVTHINQFLKEFDFKQTKQKSLTQGLFGYTAYDAIPLHHPITFNHNDKATEIPLVNYQYFQIVIVFDHYYNELYIVENLCDGLNSIKEHIKEYMQRRSFSTYKFSASSEISSNYSDETFKLKIKSGINHCLRGDVFQVVLARKFKLSYTGDDFNVYRALRSINPSPYLFYFDYGDFKLLGSSPEAQITIKNKTATIHPIAGTFKRTGDEQQDIAVAALLEQDIKENAEHVMLVDLARNDLSINSDQVSVRQFKQIEYYSHVIHLVSKVEAVLTDEVCLVKVFFDTFPAGTLSGAPKHNAMKIIDELENDPRGVYGGAVGIIGFDGSINHAICIRSAFIKDQTITYQAGCGVVALSNVDSEIQEIYNKVHAVASAVQLAQKI